MKQCTGDCMVLKLKSLVRGLLAACLCGILIFSPSGHVLAQQATIRFDHLTIENGLSANITRDVLQDSRGFIWIATQGGGLNRYDGYQIKIYQQDDQDPTSISSGLVWALYEDRSGVIWVGTPEGLNRYDRETDSFEHFYHDPGNPNSLSSNSVRSIFEDSRGALWVGTEGRGLDMLDRETGRFTHYRYAADNPRSLSQNDVRTIVEDMDGTLWVGTDGGGLNRLDRETGEFDHYKNDPKDVHSLSNDFIATLYVDRQGSLWIGTDGGGLNRLDRENGRFLRYQHDPNDPQSLSNNDVHAILEDTTGTFWVGTYGGGLNVLDPEMEKFTRYVNDGSDSHSLINNTISALSEDQSGILWVATIDGLSKYDRLKYKFDHFWHDPDDANSLSSNTANAVVEDHEGIIWIGALGSGLDRFDPETGLFSHFTHDPEDPDSLSDDNVHNVMEDSQGIIWIGTINGGLNRLDPRTGIFTHYQHDPMDPNSISHDHVWPILEDREGNLWVGTFGGGLNKFDRQTERFVNYQNDPADPYSLSDDSIGRLHEDRSGNLWVGTTDGLNVYDREAERFHSYHHDPEDPNSLSNDTISAIFEDHEGTLWIGTLGGLNKFNREDQIFKRYSKHDGLPDIAIVAILEDDQGYLWIGTYKGLTKFDPHTEVFKTYSPSDGLQSAKFNVGYTQARDGKMYFFGANGFNAFYPQDIKDNPYIPPVVLTDFKLFNDPVPVGGESPLSKAIAETSALELSYRDAVFSIEFAALHFSDPASNQYAYMLEGFDEDWISTSADRRYVTYTNLDGGEYIFRVKGSNSDGVWNEEGTALKITITPPIWETWWFRALGGLLVIGGLLLVFRQRVRGIERQRQQLELQVAQRTKELAAAKEQAEAANKTKSVFLSNMSHELRTPLNAILGYAQILMRDQRSVSRQSDGLEIIYKSGEHLLTLINDILDLSKIEAGKTELFINDFHFLGFLQGVADIIRLRAEEKGLQFTFEALTPLPEGIRADEKRLRQVLVNLLGNAVKFTDQGFVSLVISAHDTVEKAEDHVEAKIRFEVLDTGVGMAEDQVSNVFEPFEQVGDHERQEEGTGLGLSISQSLVQMMGGEITVESEAGKGSTFRFELTLPVVMAQLSAEPIIGGRIDGYKGPRRKILIADDQPYNLMVLEHMLEPLGFEIVTANNGREEVDRARETKPDLILTDMIMPVMTGFEAVQHIRSIPELKDLPIIAVSASVFGMDKQESMIAGCDNFIPKPVNAMKLFEMLRIYLNLEWSYETQEEAMADPEAGDVPETGDAASLLVPPSRAVLVEVYELARRGNISKIRELAAQIGQSDEKYKPFADRISQLARMYLDQEIQDMMQQFLSEANE